MYTTALFDLSRTLAGRYLMQYAYPWEILREWKEYVRRIGEALPTDRFEKCGNDVWVAKSVTVAETAVIVGPCVIDEDVEIRTGAYLRGGVLVGKGAVVGNSTEIKNSILFDGVQVPHYNYVGDSILGYRAHLGAGAVTSNIKSDRSPVIIREGETLYPTGLRKCGAMIGDGVEIGCGCVLNPGTVIGAHTQIYPLCSVRGVIPSGHIYKREGTIVPRRNV